MDRIIIYTGLDDFDRILPNQPALHLTKEEEMVERFLGMRMILEASHIKKLRTFLL